VRSSDWSAIAFLEIAGTGTGKALFRTRPPEVQLRHLGVVWVSPVDEAVRGVRRHILRPIPATFSRNTDAEPDQPTRSANVDAAILRVASDNTRTCAAYASKLEPIAALWYFGCRSDSNARSTVPHETPTSWPISRFECWPVESSWPVLAQSSILITLHSGWWPCFRSALTQGRWKIVRDDAGLEYPAQCGRGALPP